MSNAQRVQSANVQDVQSRNFQRTIAGGGLVFQLIESDNYSGGILPPVEAVDVNIPYPSYTHLGTLFQATLTNYNKSGDAYSSGSTWFFASLRSDKTYDITEVPNPPVNVVALFAKRTSYRNTGIAWSYDIYTKFRLEPGVRGTLTKHTLSPPANTSNSTGFTYTLETPDSIEQKIFGVRLEGIPDTPSTAAPGDPVTGKACVFWFGLAPADLPTWPHNLSGPLM